MSEGISHALRGENISSYIPSNESQTGGNTYTTNSTAPTMEAYENIFGPSARDIKHDLQQYKRHGRWHLPDILKGPNQYLTDRIDGLITDATNSPFTSRILPYKYITNVDGKIKWNVWSFDEGLASRVPYESAARTLTQSKRGFAGFAVRHGLALVMEHNFMMSEAGRTNFKNQLNQLIGSIQMTNDLDVHVALLLAPSYQKHMREKYILDAQTSSQKCRQFVDLFGFMQKNVNALDILIEEAKAMLRSWGSEMPDFMLANSKLTFGLQMNPDRTNYLTQGPEGAKRLKAGPEIDSYRGISIIPSRSFSMETGVPPRDILRRRVRVAEYYRITPSDKNRNRAFEFYNEDRDTWFSMTFPELVRHAIIGNGPDDDLLRQIASLKPEDAPPPFPHGPNNVRPPVDARAHPDQWDFFNTFILDAQQLQIQPPVGAIPAPHDYVYCLGYLNPSVREVSPVRYHIDAGHLTPLQRKRCYIEKGVVRLSQHKLAEFLQVVARNNIPEQQQALAYRVFQRFGYTIPAAGVPGYIRDFGEPAASVNYAVAHRLRIGLGCTSYLDPNFPVLNPAAPLNAHSTGTAIAKFAYLTSEADRYFLSSLSGGDAGGDIRNTLLYRLAKDDPEHPVHEAQMKIFTKIIADAIHAHGDAGGHSDINRLTLAFGNALNAAIADALKGTPGRQEMLECTLSRLVRRDDDNHAITTGGAGIRYRMNNIAAHLGATGTVPVMVHNNHLVVRDVLAWFAHRYFHNMLVAPAARTYFNQDAQPPYDWNYEEIMGAVYVPPPEDFPGYNLWKQMSNLELVVVRPNIEHNMFGVILGRGGEGLGSTFWGQTELSCYDDAQHGIWGMSYKYHERAIVINERNLVRLWDIAYDGYVGGKDDRVVNWSDNTEDRNSWKSFQNSTRELTKSYHGPSMMVMAFLHKDADDVDGKTWKPNWPSPIVYHDQRYRAGADQDTGTFVDGENGVVVQTAEFKVFDRSIPGYSTRYDDYYAKMPDFTNMAVNRKTAGIASTENEVCADMLAFQGSMRVKDAGSGATITEVHGSGHHGQDFVGVASLRSGKGYKIQAQPTPGRLV